MLAGLVFQVLTLVVFGACAADYSFAVYQHRTQLNPETLGLRQSRRFRLFVFALWVAYFGILIRCIYRVAELAGGVYHSSVAPTFKLTNFTGWVDNPILREQGLFIGLDSVPVAIAAVVLNVWHPGWCFQEKHHVSHAEETTMAGSSKEEAHV